MLASELVKVMHLWSVLGNLIWCVRLHSAGLSPASTTNANSLNTLTSIGSIFILWRPVPTWSPYLIIPGRQNHKYASYIVEMDKFQLSNSNKIRLLYTLPYFHVCGTLFIRLCMSMQTADVQLYITTDTKTVAINAADKIARQMICSNFFRTGLLPDVGLSVLTKRHCIRRLNSASCRIQWLSTSEIPVAIGNISTLGFRYLSRYYICPLDANGKLDSTREDKGNMIITEAEMTAISDLRPIHCNKTIEAVAYRISGFSREQTGLWEQTLDNPTSLIFQFCFLQRVPARTNVNHTILTDFVNELSIDMELFRDFLKLTHDSAEAFDLSNVWCLRCKSICPCNSVVFSGATLTIGLAVSQLEPLLHARCRGYKSMLPVSIWFSYHVFGLLHLNPGFGMTSATILIKFTKIKFKRPQQRANFPICYTNDIREPAAAKRGYPASRKKKQNDDVVAFVLIAVIVQDALSLHLRELRNELLCVQNRVDVNEISRLKVRHLAKNERMVKIVVIMDQQGEIFLVDLMSRRMYWLYKTKKPSYSLLLSKDVVNYIDIDPYDEALPSQWLRSTNILLNLIISQEARPRIKHDRDLKPTLPNLECPCKVYHARTPDEFIGLCINLGITKLPVGGLVVDLRWLNSYRLNKIVLKSEIWKQDKMEGLYKDKEVRVMRMKKRSNTLGKIRNLRLLNDDENFRMIWFYAWQEVDNYFYLAIKQWKCDLEQFVLVNNCESLYILRDIAIAVYKMRGNYKSVHNIINPRNVFIMHNGKPKIGFPTFMTEDDEGQLFPKHKHKRSSMSYALLFDSCSPTLQELLSHSWLSDTHKVTSFIIAFSDFIKCHSYASSLVDRDFQSYKLFVAPWNGGTNGLDTNFVNKRSNFISQMNGTSYDFTIGSSLIRIMQNGFNHHEEMSEGVRKAVGETKQRWNAIFVPSILTW
nr:hypothetical protein [Tanacetum cinerariifolium]